MRGKPVRQRCREWAHNLDNVSQHVVKRVTNFMYWQTLLRIRRPPVGLSIEHDELRKCLPHSIR